MENEFLRKVACTEKLYVASANCGVNIAYRFLIRIDNDLELSEERFDDALKKAVANCKGVNVRYHKDKWYVSDYLPKFKFIESDVDEIYAYPISWIDHRKHSFLASGIYHKKTGIRYISFEFIHCVCDGGSALNFIYDVFAALNGQPLTKYIYTVTDDDIVKKCLRKHTERPKIFVGCELAENDKGLTADRYNFLTVPYKKGGVSAKLSYAIAQQFTDKDITMMIPVDIRKYFSGNDSFYFGNHTLPIFHQCRGKSRERLSSEISTKLKNGTALSRHSSNNFCLKHIPMPIVDFIIRSYLGFLKHRKSFILCAIVSYMGEVNEARLKNPYCEVTDVIVQAEKYPFCTFDTFSIGFRGRLNVGITCENGQISKRLYNKLTDDIRECVK